MRIWFTGLLLLAGAHAVAMDKSECTHKELARTDCHLHLGHIDIRLLDKTIVWNDGTWHTVDEMPLKGEAVAWEKVDFQIVDGWPVVQLWLWDKGIGESDVQSLHWYTGDLLREQPFKILAEGVVRKRHGKGPPDAGKKQKFLYDKMENHGLKVAKGGRLEWHLNNVKKTISIHDSKK